MKNTIKFLSAAMLISAVLINPISSNAARKNKSFSADAAIAAMSQAKSHGFKYIRNVDARRGGIVQVTGIDQYGNKVVAYYDSKGKKSNTPVPKHIDKSNVDEVLACTKALKKKGADKIKDITTWNWNNKEARYHVRTFDSQGMKERSYCDRKGNIVK